MRLWIDGQCLQTSSRLRGIGRYVIELIRTIAQTRPEIEMLISFNVSMDDTAIPARSAVESWIAAPNVHVWQGPATLAELRTGYNAARRLGEIALAHHVACLAPDIALSASPFEGQHDPTSPLLTRAGHDFPWAAIFYDAIPYRFPRNYLDQGAIAAAYQRRLQAFREFNLSLAISDFARRELLDILPGVNVVQIDAGVSPDFIALTREPTDAAAIAALGLRKPFLLYVGALDWRKNLTGVIEAFSLLARPLREGLQFAVAGDSISRDLDKLQTAWARAGLPPDNLRLLGHVSDAMLVQLYKQADLVIQPSLMEGFGLTALEAMHCGAPVIAADAGALPEVIGNAQALFDPSQPAAIAARIAEILSSPSLAAALIEHGLARAREFSWQRTARLAVDALAAVARAPVAPDIPAARRITLEALGKVREPEHAAQILAAAEPAGPRPGRLLIDVSCVAELDHATGIQRVVNNIARGLLAGEAPERDLFWCNSDQGLFRAGSGARLTRLDPIPANRIIPGRADHIVMLDSSWGYTILPRVLQRARQRGADVTTVLYDLVPLKMPAFCEPHMPDAFAEWLKSALGYSTGFICISRTVADELLALLEAIRFPRPMKIGFWRLGAVVKPDERESEPAAPPDPPQFLMVSTLEPRKGYRVALDAFSKLWTDGFPGRLTIIGKRGWEVEHLVAHVQSHPEWGKKLSWLEGASDETLGAHYAGCTALVIPSYGEGFGLPIVEAALHGKPAIASDLPVFREVAQDVADVTFFASGSREALAEAIKAFSARAVAPAAARPAPIGWAESAAQFEEVVLGDHWYRIYQPRQASSYVSLDHIGDLTGAGGERPRYRLELVEGPIPAGEKKDGMRFIVRLTNQGTALWSQAGGIALGYRLLDRHGGAIAFQSPFAKIPLVQLPGDAHYMSVVLDKHGLRRRPHAIEIALFAREDGLWESALRVGL